MSAPGPTTLAELAELLVELTSGGGDAGRPFTDRLYAALPDVYRTLDVDGALYAYLSAIGDVTGVIEAVADAVDYVPPDEGGPADDTSLLVDPEQTFAPEWLAQAVGVNLARAAPGVAATHPDARAAIADARNGWRAGSRASLEAAARRALTGAQTVVIRDHLDPDPYVITVSTRASETPDPALLATYVEAIRPAGHVLAYDNDVGSWDGIEALGPWSTIDATDWAALEVA